MEQNSLGKNGTNLLPRVQMFHIPRVHTVGIGLFNGFRWVSDRIEQLSNHVLIFFQNDPERDVLPSPLGIITEEQTVIVIVYRVFF